MTVPHAATALADRFLKKAGGNAVAAVRLARDFVRACPPAAPGQLLLEANGAWMICFHHAYGKNALVPITRLPWKGASAERHSPEAIAVANAVAGIATRPVLGRPRA